MRNLKHSKKNVLRGVKMNKMILPKPKEGELILTKYATEELPKNDEIFEPEEKTIEPFYLGLSGNFTLYPKIMEGLGIATGLFLVLVQLRVKNRYAGDRLNIFDRYWKKGVIATAVTRPELCRRLGIKRKKTITEYAHRLERNKIIEIEKLRRYETFDGQLHNVYILGTHKGRKNESFFIDDLWKR